MSREESLQLAAEVDLPDSVSHHNIASTVRIIVQDNKQLLQEHDQSYLTDSLVDFWMKSFIPHVVLCVCPWWDGGTR